MVDAMGDVDRGEDRPPGWAVQSNRAAGPLFFCIDRHVLACGDALQAASPVELNVLNSCCLKD